MEASIEPSATAETKTRLTMARAVLAKNPIRSSGTCGGCAVRYLRERCMRRNGLVYGASNGLAEDGEATNGSRGDRQRVGVSMDVAPSADPSQKGSPSIYPPAPDLSERSPNHSFRQ